MMLSGWILMIVVVTSFTMLLIWCSWKVVSTPQSTEHVHSHLELDTPDMHQSE